MTILIFLGRLLNILICSKLTNLARSENILDKKKQFFLWFAGVRGAMAFALAIKSKEDFPNVGPIFLVLTLIFISITLLYSTILIDFTLKKCEIINYCEAENLENSEERHKNCFESFKSYIEVLNSRYLMPCVNRDNRYERTSDNKLKDINDQIEALGINNGETKHMINGSKDDSEIRGADSINNDQRNLPIKNLHLFE
jgi:NhaP-type Na+/H+ or K+/H+ antiporter